MKVDIRRFIKNNKVKIINTSNLRKKILIIDRGRDDSVFSNSLSGYICNKYRFCKVDLLSENTKNHELIKVYESFNIQKKYDSSILNFNIKNLILYLKTLMTLTLSYIKISLFGFNWLVKKYRLGDILIGDLIYDSYIRYDLQFLNESIFNTKFLKILTIAIYRYYFFKKLVDKNNYSLLICNTPGNLYSGLGLRVFLKNKVPAVCILSTYFRYYKKLGEVYEHYFKTHKKDLKKITRDKGWLEKTEIYIKNRWKGNIVQRDAKKALIGAKISKDQIFRKLKINEKHYSRIGYFAPHAFSDANYLGGYFLFKGYYEHFYKTINYIKEQKNILWFVKEHPSSKVFGEKGLVEKIVKNSNAKNILFCPKYLSTLKLLSFSDIVVTGRGTIGQEAALLGIKPIIAGNTHYNSLGFTLEPKTHKNYRKLLLNTKSNYKLTKGQIFKAKISVYNSLIKKHEQKSKVYPIARSTDVDLKKKKVVQRFDYNFNFYKELNTNLKTHSILNDSFYLALKSILLKNIS